MNRIRECNWCGKEFVQHHHNEKYCSEECKCQGYREAERISRRTKVVNKNVEKCKAPNVSMEMVLDAMNRLSKKYGRFVQYREVQVGLETGKLYVKGGVIID